MRTHSAEAQNDNGKSEVDGADDGVGEHEGDVLRARVDGPEADLRQQQVHDAHDEGVSHQPRGAQKLEKKPKTQLYHLNVLVK